MRTMPVAEHDSRHRGRTGLRIAALAASILWLGGFTFYGLVVIPTGAAVLGEHRAFGFVTQQVTLWLNALAVLTLVLRLPALRRERRQRWAWIVAAATTAALITLHPYATSFLDLAHHDVRDPLTFYQVHRVYLITAAGQWLAFLGLLAGLLAPGPVL